MPPIETHGQAAPLGANATPTGVNFSLFSRTASGVELLLFDREDDTKPTRTITLDPVSNHTYHYWHAFVPGLQPGQLYGYRVMGPNDPAHGLRFDSTKVLLDPYGKGLVIPKNYSPDFAKQPGDNTSTAMKNVVVDLSSYDWQGDVPLRHPSLAQLSMRCIFEGLPLIRIRASEGKHEGLSQDSSRRFPTFKTLGSLR